MIEVVKSNKKYFFYSFLFTLIAHLIKFVNYYPTWDSVLGIKKDWMGMSTSGRWFSGVAEILLSSKYDLQWITGIEATFFIALTGVLIIDLFRLEERKMTYVSLSLLGVFPSFAATFMYGLWTSAYMFSLFLAVAAVYYCIKNANKMSILVGILMMTISLAIYQAYYLFATVMFAYYVAMTLMEKSDKSTGNKIIRFIIMISASMVIYLIINRLMQLLLGYKMADYQGIAEAGKMSLGSIILGIKKIVLQAGYFFAGKKCVTFYGLLNFAILLLIAIIFINRVLIKGSFTLGYKIIISVLLLSVFPINYAFYLISPGVEYHKLMELGMYFAYFSGIIVLKAFSNEKRNKKVSNVILTLLSVLVIYNFINNNIAYYQARIRYEKTIFEASELMTRIDQVNDAGYRKIIVIGDFQDQAEDDIVTVPHITGAGTENFLNSEWHILRFSKYYLNRNYEACSGTERDNVINKLDLKSMPSYPYGNYIQIVGDVIVVKLSDAEQTTENH